MRRKECGEKERKDKKEKKEGASDCREAERRITVTLKSPSVSTFGAVGDCTLIGI